MDLPHQQNAEINDIQMCWNEEPKATFTETNEHLRQNTKNILDLNRIPYLLSPHALIMKCLIGFFSN